MADHDDSLPKASQLEIQQKKDSKPGHLKSMQDEVLPHLSGPPTSLKQTPETEKSVEPQSAQQKQITPQNDQARTSTQNAEAPKSLRAVSSEAKQTKTQSPPETSPQINGAETAKENRQASLQGEHSTSSLETPPLRPVDRTELLQQSQKNQIEQNVKQSQIESRPPSEGLKTIQNVQQDRLASQGPASPSVEKDTTKDVQRTNAENTVNGIMTAGGERSSSNSLLGKEEGARAQIAQPKGDAPMTGAKSPEGNLEIARANQEHIKSAQQFTEAEMSRNHNALLTNLQSALVQNPPEAGRNSGELTQNPTEGVRVPSESTTNSLEHGKTASEQTKSSALQPEVTESKNSKFDSNSHLTQSDSKDRHPSAKENIGDKQASLGGKDLTNALSGNKEIATKAPLLDPKGNQINLVPRADIIDKINGPITNTLSGIKDSINIIKDNAQGIIKDGISVIKDGAGIVFIAGAKVIDSVKDKAAGVTEAIKDGASRAIKSGESSDAKASKLEDLTKVARKLPEDFKDAVVKVCERLVKNPNEKFEGKDKQLADILRPVKNADLIKQILTNKVQPDFSKFSEHHLTKFLAVFTALIDHGKTIKGERPQPLSAKAESQQPNTKTIASSAADKTAAVKAGRPADNLPMNIAIRMISVFEDSAFSQMPRQAKFDFGGELIL